MKSGLLTLFVVLSLTPVFATDDTGRVIGGVDAVYHDGLVTFTVLHPEAVSASIEVYDLATDTKVFDSGPRGRTQLSWPAGHDFDGGYRYLVTAWNEQGEVVVSQAAANKRQTSISEISFDTVPDNTSVAGPGEIDLLGDVNIGAPPGVLLDQNYSSAGGRAVFYAEDGTTVNSTIGPDTGGDGGRLVVYGGAADTYVQLEGAHGSYGDEPYLHVKGTSEFLAYAGRTGTDSVIMPADAVSATEIENEVGVASERGSGTIDIPDIPTNIRSATITAPTAGYILATSSINLALNHANGVRTGVSCGISETGNSASEVLTALVDGDTPSGAYIFPLSPTGVFVAVEGSNQLFLVCYRLYGNSAYAADRRLNLLFVPTPYGTVPTESAR